MEIKYAKENKGNEIEVGDILVSSISNNHYLILQDGSQFATLEMASCDLYARKYDSIATLIDRTFGTTKYTVIKSDKYKLLID